MEAFSRILSIIITLAVLIPAIILSGLNYEYNRNRDIVETKLGRIYAVISETKDITAGNLLGLYEAAALCRGTLGLSLGCNREVLSDDDGAIYGYKEFLYLNDIEELIYNEGSIKLLSGDSVSISVKVGNNTILPASYGLKAADVGLAAGGIV